MSGVNSKGDLIARLIALGRGAPTFEAQSSGPAHERTFRASVSVDGRVLGSGEGRTKRDAERAAAEAGLLALNTSPAPVQPPAETWPIYAQVLAESIGAALEFAGEDATLEDVQRDAARFYRGLLAELGHQPEDQG